uniref:Taste receptor type 2 n=1 Tax=Prolemur simus TaxID=1328070 RepID=A0A8C9DPR1_PROSS
MSTGIENTFLIVEIGEFIAGILGNGLIVLANGLDWVKSQKISLADSILTSLALSRIIQLWIMLFESFLMVLWPHLYFFSKLTKFLTIFWMISDHLGTWFATCLSVFYFFKIASLSQPCFIWLRWRIGRVLLVLQLLSLCLLFFNFSLADTLTGFWINVYSKHERNSTLSSDVSTAVYRNIWIVFNLINLIPFLLSLTSLVLLFLSLMRHIRNLQLNSMGSRDVSTQAHRRAIKMVTSFLLFFIVHFFSVILSGWIFLKLQNQQASLFVMLTLTLFPSGHSFVLIMGNSKLRQTAVGLLRHVKSYKTKNLFPIFDFF